MKFILPTFSGYQKFMKRKTLTFIIGLTATVCGFGMMFGALFCETNSTGEKFLMVFGLLVVVVGVFVTLDSIRVSHKQH